MTETENTKPGDDKGYVVGKGKPPEAQKWPKGKSGNPKGRPKGSKNVNATIRYWLSVEEKVRNPITKKDEKLTQLDIATLGMIAEARNGNVSAYNSLLDRTEGKPVQSTKLLGADGGAVEFLVGFATDPDLPATDATPKQSTDEEAADQ